MTRPEELYPNNLKNWDLDLAKAPGFDHPKEAPYYNMEPLSDVKSRELSLKPKTNLSDYLGIRSPFKWEERQIILQDRILYVPKNIPINQSFQFPGWESPSIFGNTLPIKVEYCTGNGDWIAAKAKENSSCNWVAVEKKFARVKKIWSKMKNLQLNQLLIICGEGYEVTRHYFPSESVAEIFINFPDPWPKTRHAKHRLIRQPFIDEMYRILKPKGKFTFVTDDVNYSNVMIKEMGKNLGFSPEGNTPYITHLPGYGTSYFENLWREKGREIRYHIYERS